MLIIILFVLILLSIIDIKHRQIDARIMAIILIISLVYRFFEYSININLLLDILPGIFLIFMSFISGDGIGSADGLLILSLGILFGFYNNIELVMISGLITAFLGGILWLIKKVSLKTSMPFIPFITLGFIIQNIKQILQEIRIII